MFIFISFTDFFVFGLVFDLIAMSPVFLSIKEKNF